MSNEQNMVVVQHGDRTSLTIGGHQASQAAEAAPFEAARVHGGTTKFSMTPGAQVETGGVSRYNTGQQSFSSVAASIQMQNGKQTVELVPGDPSSRTLLTTALRDGLVEPVGGGQYRDVVSASSQEGTQSPKGEEPVVAESSDPGAGVFDPEEDSLWAEDIAPLEQFAYDSATSSVTVAVLSGADNLSTAAKNLAQHQAIPLELAEQYVNEGYAMHERIVAREVAAMGIDADRKEGFYEWARNNKGRALHNAIQSLQQRRDVNPFRMLAVEYARHN